jgi:triose/dihydroxyacetone kinase / FAD-AMP lyase (cyclizing)
MLWNLAIYRPVQGDIQSFKIAIAKAKASGLKAELVIVSDDVGKGRSRMGIHGRKGIAGTVLVVKIAGALAASG